MVAAWAEQVLADPEDEDDDEEGYRFAGIRYISRLDHEQVCWAVWPLGVGIDEVERRAVEQESDDLRTVAERYNLKNF